ncbi:L-lactate dehydrogenase A-like 6A [Chelonus insularis]|uniref:L-lactate dehydrogenase A-like 6A n=1 Tax=Chelonus insularis TaxID=460826 RepID=UPI00158D26C9|nr:L-lactate dehydrogenase A-like 6A [Chelonus insularis]
MFKKMIKTMRLQRAVSSETSVCLREDLLCKVADATKDGMDKVTVVGAGTVGISCANAILFQKISSHVAIVDAFPKKLEGEGLDYCHGSVFIGDPNIEYDTDFCISRNSKVVIVAAGARQKKDESRLDLVHKNVEIIKNIIPPLIENSPNATFVIVSNPVDILSWVAWKMSDLPVNRIIGVGCHLDTARFRYLISQRLGISSKSVHGFIIGEHGDSQVPLWSGVNVAGVLFRDILPDIGLDMDEQGWNHLINDLIRAGSTVRCLKGYSNTAVGLAAADITKAILRNRQTVKSVSTLAQGHYDICHEMFLSLPCTVGDNGITQVIRMRMTEHEKKLLQKSASILYDIQKNIKIT